MRDNAQRAEKRSSAPATEAQHGFFLRTLVQEAGILALPLLDLFFENSKIFLQSCTKEKKRKGKKYGLENAYFKFTKQYGMNF